MPGAAVFRSHKSKPYLETKGHARSVLAVGEVLY